MYKFLLFGATLVAVGIGAFKMISSKKHSNSEQQIEQPTMG